MKPHKTASALQSSRYSARIFVCFSFFLWTIALCLTSTPLIAGDKAQKQYFSDMKALHKTSFVLDYLLQPKNFQHVCGTLYPDLFSDLSEKDQEARARVISVHTDALRGRVQDNERQATLALINDFYLHSNPEKGLDYERFFAVYLGKAQKSRKLIKADLEPKTPTFLAFLKTGGVLTQESCQTRLKNDRIEDLISFWPKDVDALREELDALLSGLPVPKEYRTAYRRLLQ